MLASNDAACLVAVLQSLTANTAERVGVEALVLKPFELSREMVGGAVRVGCQILHAY